MKKGLRLAVFAILWFTVTFWAEWRVPSAAIKSCNWPSGTGTHVALIADPQIVDDNTYPGRNRLFLWLTRKITDRFMARNWRLVLRHLSPEHTWFLGDLFDGGREWDDEPWREELARFKTVFHVPEELKDRVHFQLPGNHDIGFGDTIVTHARTRFVEEFGPSNSLTVVGSNHIVVTLDTISLSNTKDANIGAEANTLVKSFERARRPILLTHVPLNRPAGSSCGPLRESNTPLQWTRGNQYMTQVSPELTTDILTSINPAMVFSGDDHDACEFIHQYALPSGTLRRSPEYIVKSFSMAMGIKRPGLELLTLNDADEEASICLVSPPFRPFQALGIAALVTIMFLVVRELRTSRRHESILPTHVDDVELKAKTQFGPYQQHPRLFLSLGSEVCACAVGCLAAEWLVTQYSYA